MSPTKTIVMTAVFRAGLDDVAAASPEFHENALMGTR
jgi:hypothetical protein